MSNTTVDGRPVAITGASGLVGSALIPELATAGHRIIRIGRRSRGAGDIAWDPAAGRLPAEGLEGVTAVVHLAGENIAAGRWTAALKARIRDSRVQGTRLLAETLAKLNQRPQVLVCASATGYYGERGDTPCDEDSACGSGFLADVCREWEDACQPARESGIRVVNLRIGVVLTPQGGALAKMLLPFKLGVGGVVGSGRQYWSWVALEDVVGAIGFCLERQSLHGPVNAVAPQAATNREFTKTLGSVLHRPTLFPMPAFAARLALGEMANDLLLASTRVVPRRLMEAGYQFKYPELDAALRHYLGS